MDISSAWLPVDQLAQGILGIATSCLDRAETTCGDGGCSTGDRTDNDEDDSVYKIVNPHPFPWATLLDQLQQHGLKYNVVAFATWLQLLEASEDQQEEKTNPAVKLIPHYRKTYVPGAVRLVKTLRMENARRDSATLRPGSTDLLAGGVLGHVRGWLDRWEAPSATRLKVPRLPARPQVDRV